MDWTQTHQEETATWWHVLPALQREAEGRMETEFSEETHNKLSEYEYRLIKKSVGMDRQDTQCLCSFSMKIALIMLSTLKTPETLNDNIPINELAEHLWFKWEHC